jgi:hypothetical protein
VLVRSVMVERRAYVFSIAVHAADGSSRRVALSLKACGVVVPRILILCTTYFTLRPLYPQCGPQSRSGCGESNLDSPGFQSAV